MVEEISHVLTFLKVIYKWTKVFMVVEQFCVARTFFFVRNITLSRDVWWFKDVASGC